MNILRKYDKLIVAALVITIALLTPRILYGYSYAEPLALISQVATIFIVGFSFVAIYKVFVKKHISSFGLGLALSLALLTLLGLLLAGIGLGQDVFGVHCSGFFGESSTCASGATLNAMVLLLNPLVLSTLGLTSLAGLYSLLKPGKQVKRKK